MPWLIDGVFRQGDREGLCDLPVAAPCREPARFVHAVNPFPSPTGPSNDRVQAITYESMRRARDFHAGCPVHLTAVVAPPDRDCVPPGFEHAGTLERDVRDLTAFGQSAPLPLIFDVLNLACGHAGKLAESKGEDLDSVYLVFTNVDIALMPHFYETVAEVVRRGYQTATIFRRTILPIEPDVANLNQMYAEYGSTHDGFDCFVFPVSAFASYARNDACIGRGFVMRGLLYNMVAGPAKLAIIRKAHLTFHLGDDRNWKAAQFDDSNRFNVEQTKRVLLSLMERDSATARRLVQFCQANGEPFKFAKQA